MGPYEKENAPRQQDLESTYNSNFNMGSVKEHKFGSNGEGSTLQSFSQERTKPKKRRFSQQSLKNGKYRKAKKKPPTKKDKNKFNPWKKQKPKSKQNIKLVKKSPFRRSQHM